MSGIGLNFLNNNYNNYSNYPQTQAPKEDPNAYAQEYADQNGISLNEAKTKLSEMFGAPQQGMQLPGIDASSSIFTQANSVSATSSTENVNNTDASSTPGSSNSILSKLLDFFAGSNITSEDAMNKDPDELAQQYADENGISLEEAKAELSQQFGDPEQR